MLSIQGSNSEVVAKNTKEEKPTWKPKYMVIKRTPLKHLWEKPIGYYYAKQLGLSEFLAMNLHL